MTKIPLKVFVLCILAGVGHSPAAGDKSCAAGDNTCAASATEDGEDTGLLQTQASKNQGSAEEGDSEEDGADEDEGSEELAGAGSNSLTAVFGQGVKGKLVIKKGSSYVGWATNLIKVPNSLVQKVCGKTLTPKATEFMYHIHDKWTWSQTSASGDDCGASYTGGHWDPTAACGGASGNPVCETCGTKGKNYTCSADSFDKNSVYQYRFLTPDALGEGGSVCEFGDLSGMYGNLKAKPKKHKTNIRASGTKKATMTATYGEITAENIGPDCTYGNLIQNYDKGPGYELASASEPLDQLSGKSIVVHCATGYENVGARIFCAKLT